jgi:hypothetical protein
MEDDLLSRHQGIQQLCIPDIAGYQLAGLVAGLMRQPVQVNVECRDLPAFRQLVVDEVTANETAGTGYEHTLDAHQAALRRPSTTTTYPSVKASNPSSLEISQ